MAIDRDTLARLIDHTLLKPEATPADVAALCREATELGVAAVCVSPSMLPLATGSLPAEIALATVCGFPSGAHHASVKAAEAARSVEQGATEIDVVAGLALIGDARWSELERELVAVRTAAPAPVKVKVILETALWTADQVGEACRVAEAAGLDYVKTSTGFHPAGGATIEAVATMAATVGGRLGVKASGGIRTYETAVAMVEAGATRLGMSASRAVLDAAG